MKLKAKMFIYISLVVCFAVFTAIIASLILSHKGWHRQESLQKEITENQIHQQAGAGSLWLKKTLPGHIEKIESKIKKLCRNRLIKRAIVSDKRQYLQEQAALIAELSTFEFVAFFDKKGMLITSWPGISDKLYFDKNYQKSLLFNRLSDQHKNEDDNKTIVLSMIDRWANPAAKGYGVDAKTVLISAGAIYNGENQLGGFVITGSKKAWLQSLFKDFYRETGQISIVTNGASPVLWSGLSSSKNNLTNALKRLKFLNPVNGTNSMSAVAYTVELLGEKYLVFYHPLSALTHVQKTVALNKYGVVTGIPLSDGSRADTGYTNDFTENTVRAHLFTGLIILLISLIFIYILVVFITNPIALAASAAEKIAAGELPEMPEAGRTDELGTILAAMNNLLASLKASQRTYEVQLEALKESHERNSIILSTIKSGVLIIDGKTHEIVDVNEAAQEMIGETYENIIGSVCHNFVCPAEKGACPISDKGETLDDSERELLTKDGGRIPILKTAEPIVLGGRNCFLESFVDISKLKKAEEALIRQQDQLQGVVEARTRELRANEVMFRTIFDSSPQAILLTELDAGQIVDANETFCRLSQYTKTELIGSVSTDLGFFSEEERLIFINTLKQLGRVDGFEMDCKAKDGTIVNTLMYAKPLKISDKILILTTFVNVTGKLKAEKALVESEEKYRAILNESSIGYYEVDTRGRFTFVSDALCEIMGMSRDELIGLSYKEYTSEETAHKIFLVFNRIFLTGKMKKRFEYQVYVKNKNSRVLETSVALLKDHLGRITGFSGIVLNITEQRDMELQLQSVQKMEAIGTLAGGIAHDFNNILAAILGYAELARLNSPENQKVQKFLTQLCLASERARGLVKQILAFSRQNRVEKKPIDIGGIINEALKLLRASIPSTIEIVQSVEEHLGVVEADETQIHQIVMNLCANAFHAMEKEGGQLDVSLIPVEIGLKDVSAWQDISPGRYLKFMVADTGHGMSPNLVGRIFEPYFTTKEVGEGSGMGLATVHGIVKHHGGDIKVFSEPDAGTSFHILFPLIENKVEEKVVEVSDIKGGTERILFVDDEPFLIDIGKEFLEKLGYTVDVWPNPNDALEAFRLNHTAYDMVITDMTMPEMTGLKLAGEIKLINPGIPIVLCTGYSKNITPENAIDMGISSVLMKPLTLEKIAKTVRRILDKS